MVSASPALANEARAGHPAVDLFFCVSDEIGWEKDWTDAELPDDFHDVFALIGQALHDTVTSPSTAANFDCLPEQLLERLRRVPV